jgi:Fe-S-cluster-containing dehydrogenase component
MLKKGREVVDGEFQTACSNACSNGAMAFGDVNDKGSEIKKLADDERMYHLLEHVGTKPNVIYHVKEILSTKLLIKKQDKGLCRLTTKQPLENL